MSSVSECISVVCLSTYHYMLIETETDYFPEVKIRTLSCTRFDPSGIEANCMVYSLLRTNDHLFSSRTHSYNAEYLTCSVHLHASCACEYSAVSTVSLEQLPSD